MMACPASRDATMCQKLVASKNDASSAMGTVKISAARQYSPNTVRVPETAAGRRTASLVFPKTAMDAATVLAYRPSRPLFSG